MKQDTRRFVSQKTGNLYIAKVEPSEVGNYTCVVTNTVTQTTVQGPPTPLVLRSDGDVPLWIYLIKLLVCGCKHSDVKSCFCVSGIMGEYEPKIEVQLPEILAVAKGLTVKLECFALGK